MRISVIPPQFLNGLPNSILFYDIQFDSSFYQKKTKPYSKLSIPRGYTHQQSLCKQFGIEPHTLLCMDSTLWRQQIIDTITFDLCTENVSIKFINQACSRYTFKECEDSFNKKDDSVTKSSISSPSNPSLSKNVDKGKSRIQSKILEQLEFLQKIALAHNQNSSSSQNPIALISTMNQIQLSDLKKSTRPLPLLPTDHQRTKDLNRFRSHTENVNATRKPTSKKRRAPSLRLKKKRKKPKQTRNTLSESEEEGQELDSPPIINLPSNQIYEIILSLSNFRSTLLDIFQNKILKFLKVKLPITYPLWVVQSELDYVREKFESHAQHFIKILHDSTSLEKLRKSEETDQLNNVSINELEEWCSTVGPACPIINEEELGTSAETSLEELNPSTREPLIQDVSETYSSSLGFNPVHLRLSWVVDLKKKEDQNALHPSTPSYIMSDSQIAHDSVTNSSAFSSLAPGPSPIMEPSTENFIPSRDPTPPLSPTFRNPNTFTRPNSLSATDPLFHFPVLVLEPILLCTINPKKSQDIAIELSTQLAEERIRIDELETTFETLNLLEEERKDKERFSGLDRFSDIITTSRLTNGWGEGNIIDTTKDAIITITLTKIKKRMNEKVSNNHHDQQMNLLPNKQSEIKRRNCLKRRIWLTVTRRLDRNWIPHLNFNEKEPIWPEPIFIKKKSKKNKSDKKSKSEMSIDYQNRNSAFIASRKPINEGKRLNVIKEKLINDRHNYQTLSTNQGSHINLDDDDDDEISLYSFKSQEESYNPKSPIIDFKDLVEEEEEEEEEDMGCVSDVDSEWPENDNHQPSVNKFSMLLSI